MSLTLSIALALYMIGMYATWAFFDLLRDFADMFPKVPRLTTVALVANMLIWPLFWVGMVLIALAQRVSDAKDAVT